LASGETISFQGQIQGSAFTGSVINTTHGLQSTFSGTVTGQQITGEFSGVGSDQTFNGAFTVYR